MGSGRLGDSGKEDLGLIEDQSLRNVADDRLGHTAFVDELELVIRNVQTPANIAVYAPWGAGKTGLANLLEGRLKDKPREVRFARYNAFKHKETPLRRHFLLEMAKTMGLGDEVRKTLYDKKVRNTIEVPWNDFWRMLGMFMLAISAAFVALLAFVFLAALVVTSIQGGDFLDRYSAWVTRNLVLVLAPATLIGGFLAMAGKTFTGTTETSEPSSDEQFEGLFENEILAKAGTRRLVVFIDELDRCSSVDVATTLETIKTFLEIKNCVFVVAADQQVLEQALTRGARQATPVDEVNPYYSSGSAYLDKIFQYQFELPPLMPRRLSGFARELVEGRGGPWSEVDVKQVVPVLIPTHVASPRRVKALLNSFVLAYRTTAERARVAGRALDLPSRAPELAKLVCLRREFPLFAQALVRDERLSELMLLPLEDEDVKSEYPAHLIALANGFRGGSVPTDQVLARTEGEQADLLATAQSGLLVAYMQKTRDIRGPRRDLIYLEGAGEVFGLPDATADGIEAAALDGRAVDVRSALDSLPLEEHPAVLRLLAQKAREADLSGVEADNVVSTALQTVAWVGEEPAGAVADELAAAFSGHEDYGLRPEDLQGAILLGSLSGWPVAQALLTEALGRTEVLENSDLGLFAIGRAGLLPRARTPRLGPVLAARLADSASAEGVAADLAAMDKTLASELLRAGRAELIERLKTPPAQLEDPGQVASEDENGGADLAGEPIPAQEAVAVAIDKLLTVSESRALAEALFSCALSVAEPSMNRLLQQRLPQLTPIQSQGVAQQVLESVESQDAGAWTLWLSTIPESAVLEEQHQQRVEDLLEASWVEATTSPGSMEEAGMESRLAALIRLRGGQASRSLPQRVAQDLGLRGGVSADDVLIRFRWAGVFRRANAVAPSETSSLVIGEIAAAIGGALPPDILAPVAEHVSSWVSEWAESSTPDALRALRDSAKESPSLGSPMREKLALVAGAHLAAQAADPAPYSTTEVRALVESWKEAFAEGFSAWLVAFARDPAEVAGLVETMGPVPQLVQQGLDAYASRISAQDRVALVRSPILNALDRMPDADFLAHAGLAGCDFRRLLDCTVELFNRATNASAREVVLDVLEMLEPSFRQADTATRTLLVKRVYLGVARSGVQGARLAMRYPPLAGLAPSSMKADVAAALRKGLGRSKKHKARVEQFVAGVEFS